MDNIIIDDLDHTDNSIESNNGSINDATDNNAGSINDATDNNAGSINDATDNNSEPNVLPNNDVTDNKPNTDTDNKQSTNDITIKINKEALISLVQNLNTNLLVNIGAYRGVLNKLKTISTNSDLENDITSLTDIERNIAELFNKVQKNLDVSSNNIINPEEVIAEANKTTALTDQLISAQVSSILAGLATTALLLGGKKRKTKKHKRGKGKQCHRYTRRN